MFRSTRSPLLIAALALTWAACSSTDNGTGTGGTGGGTGGGGFSLESNQTIAVKDSGKVLNNNGTIAINAGGLAAGAKLEKALVVSNSGSVGDLQVSKVALEYQGAPGEESPAFTCAAIIGGQEVPCDQAKFPAISPAGKGDITAVTVLVAFKKPADQANRSATLVVYSNDLKKNEIWKQKFQTAAGQAKISVQPETVDFGFVSVGSNPVADGSLLNVGNGELLISSIDLSSLDKDLFKLVLQGKEYPTGGVLAQNPPLSLKAGDVVPFSLLYSAKDDKPRSVEMLLSTNDPSLVANGVGVKRVPVKVNSTGPCLLVSPKTVVFGPTQLGQTKVQALQIKSCGDEPLEIKKMEIGTDPTTSSGNFGIKWESLSQTGGKAPTDQAPLKLPVNGVATLELTYQPDKLSPTKPNGGVTLDSADLVLSANTANGGTTVKLEGYGASADCPTPIITIAEGDTVTPQTVLHLDGKQSYATGSTIGQYEWEVDQAKGSVALFTPNNKAGAVTFQPNIAGEYTFRLNVYDASGKKSCAPAVKVVKVIPDQAIHVELLWKTPGDKDESDTGPGVGTDLDLHFAHQFAAGQDYDGDGKPDPWFAGQYDCFWFNCGNGNTVEWGSYDPNMDDDPSLDRDDTDGAGPENLNLTLPEEGRTYAVGVHYYNDFGLGVSVATVRVYIYGTLQYEVTSSNLSKGDMWYVARVSWPQADIEAALKVPGTPGHFITKKYPTPALD